MTKSIVKLLLNQADFPFTYDQVSRSTIENQDASPRMPRMFYGDDVNADFGIPQLIYVENLIPSSKGMFSPGTYPYIAPYSVPTTACDRIIIIKSGPTNSYIMIPAGGLNLWYDVGSAAWISASPFVFANDLITSAEVNGRTLICYERTKIIEFDPGTGLFNTLALTYPPGLSIADVYGIGSASNYLLFFTLDTVYWCSPLDILDFADIDQGAGNQIPNELVGEINCIKSISGGCVIYTYFGAIGVRYTNNAAAPFVFRAIPGCAGVKDGESVGSAVNGGFHYISGRAGMQKLSLSEAVNVFPALTEFCANFTAETWNTSTKTLTIAGNNPGIVKVTILTTRYLVVSISIGIPSSNNIYSYAFIYDFGLERWGKLNIPHVDVYTQSDNFPAGLTYFNFLQCDGTVIAVYPDRQHGYTLLPAVAIFGHIQQRHDRYSTLNRVTLDGQTDQTTPSIPTVTLLSSDNGKDRNMITAMTRDAVSTTNFQQYSARVTARNIDLVVEGGCNLDTLLVELVKHGHR